MEQQPPNPWSTEQPTRQAVPASGPGMAFLNDRQNELGFFWSILLSIAVHIGVVILIVAVIFILKLLGITLLTFDRPERLKDIEFQLVTAPEETPRNLRTKNRAERNTRSGGQKIAGVKEAETQKKAGNPQPKPTQTRQVAQKPAKPQPVVQPQPQPRKAQPQPVRQTQVAQKPQPTQQQTQPAPPKPRVTAPKPSANRQHIAALPNPLSPIKVPDAPGPVANTGPVVRGPSGGAAGGSHSGGSSGGPATVPGQFSGGGRPSAGGGPSGQGGRGSYSQYGSPGGGGGRPGIDAMAEPDFGPYLAELQRRIRRNWNPPEDREDKTVVLMFTISKDGRVLSINTKRSSGYGNADAAARSAVERSAPFRPLPPEYRNSSINVEFTFDYNVFQGKASGISRR